MEGNIAKQSLCKHRDKKVYPFDRCETFTKNGRRECNKCRGALQTERRTSKVHELEDALAKMTLERNLLQKKQDPEEQLKESTTRAQVEEQLKAAQANLVEARTAWSDEIEDLKRLLQEKNEYQTTQEEQLKTVKARLNTCISEKKELQEKHNTLMEALLGKDAEHTALQKEYKKLLEKVYHLESSLQSSRRSSLTREDCTGCLENQPNQLAHSSGCLKSLSSSLTMSPESKRKKYKAEECKKCGKSKDRFFKNGNPRRDHCTCE